LFRSKVTALICGKSHQVLHRCGVNPRAASWLCMLRLSHSPFNPDYKHYRLCSCGLSRTKTHILLECDLTRARGVSSPKIWGEAKLFDFRRITLFCLEKRLSKHKLAIFSANFWGTEPLLARPGYAYDQSSTSGC